MVTWSPAHVRAIRSATWQRVAAGVVLGATLTGAAAAVLGASAWYAYGAVAYIAVAVLALFSPNAITAQVIGGQLLAGSLLLASDGDGAPGAITTTMIVVGIVATAELLGIAARLANAIERDARADLRSAAVRATIAGGAFGVMLLIAGLTRLAGRPTGILAIGVASGACVLLATVLVSSRFAQQD